MSVASQLSGGMPSSKRKARWFQHIRAAPIGSAVILFILVGTAVFAPTLAPFDPLDTNLPDRLQPPALLGGSWDHPLGTDATGRDILSRILYGARISLTVGAASLAAGALVGTTIGLVAGYLGGRLDAILMRIADLSLSYPIILLALLLAAAYGAKSENVVIAVAFVLWARFARVVRAEALSVRERDHVALARIAGASSTRIILRHIMPNVMNTVLVLASLQLGWAILAEAALSFLGAGIPPPNPAWGSMVAQGREYVVSAWWVPTMPGLAILVTVLSVNLLGDWLRDRLDPRLRPL